VAKSAASLDVLVDRLRALVAVLARDPGCTWLAGFRRWAEEAEAIRSAGGPRDEAVLLAAQVMQVFGGMGSFNDYIPHRGGVPAPWADEVNELRSEVFAAALAVRTVDSVRAEPGAAPDRGRM
jgi:hypothetical protein